MFAKEKILLCLIIILHVHQCLNLCIEHERRALLKIEKDIYDPDSWLSSWRKGGDCCNWQGITCHNTTGHVIGLDLHYPYSWPFSDDEKPDKSKLNPSLVDLEHLTYLDLSFNNFFGASIPIFIGSLTHLEHLDLSSSRFKGTIPPQLGNLSSLQLLKIDNMYEPVSFDLHVDDLHWLSGLTSLTYLKMSSVDLSTAIDWFQDISKLPFIATISLEACSLSSIPMTMPSLNNFTFLRTFLFDGNEQNSIIPGWLLNNISSLERLSFDNCGLYGELPLLSKQVSNLKFLNLPGNHFEGEVLLHLDRLPLLEELYLPFNNINAPFSETLWNLTHLTRLDLQANQIRGNLPKTLGNYSKLEYLFLSFNNITGEIPHSIGNLYKLIGLDLEDNNIGGKIPDSIRNLKNLIGLELSVNLFNGEIPHVIFNLTNLGSLTLSNNNFSGEVPKSIMNLNYLDRLDLSNNKLIGSIFFGNQSLLKQLDLSNNFFSGMPPFLRNISSQLVVINLSNNRFSGNIPDLFNFHPFLQSLQLGRNKLHGPIPSSLKYCTLLTVLDLSENKLFGKIPSWIGGALSSLRVLSLRSNCFIGEIPRELSYLTSLQILDLSHNYISGNFSLYFDNFTVMSKMKNISEENFSVFGESLFYVVNIWLNKQGTVRQYTTTLSNAILMDVSSNLISGEIPNGIAKLIGLKYLYLSRNHFIGNIPKNIGLIKDLEVLDLSSNELSGEIPSTMAEMTYLSYLNLSHNKLFGMIPTGNQFKSFADPAIYSDNSNLCGWPLPKCFRSINNNADFDGKENEEKEYWYGKTWINAGTIVGFLISYCGLFVILLLNKSMRYLHFYYVDKLYILISLQFYFGIAKIKSKFVETEMH